MTSLVAGGSGYFGHVLVNQLLARGEEVAVFDLVDSTERPANVRFIQGDIRDPAAVAAACAGMDFVYHNIAQLALEKSHALLHSVNRDGTENMLRAARDAGARKLVYTSTAAVYGVPRKLPLTTDMEPTPDEEYGLAKYEGELCCRKHMAEGFDVAILRPMPIVGSGRLGIYHILFEWIRGGYNVPVLGSGNNRFQFIHALDFAEACILAAHKPGSGEYNIGTDRYGTMRDMLEELCAAAGTGSRVRSVPMAPAVWGMKLTTLLGLSPLGLFHAQLYGRSVYVDITREKAELAWQPRYSNSEMLIENYQWYLENRERIMADTARTSSRGPLKHGVLNLVKHLL
jgi:nucleoside-diphosphate-sugar epimerase